MATPNSTITPTSPGSGGVYETLASLFDPGYKIYFQTPYRGAPVSAFLDPRGIIPGLPASQLSYEISEQVSETAIYDAFSASVFGISAITPTVGQVTDLSTSVFSLIGFEGRDVVDLPTTGLIKGDVITVPDKVFLPIFAGTSKFLGPNDNLSAKAAQEYVKKSPANLVLNIVPSPVQPVDAMGPTFGLIANNFPNLVDVTSNQIRVSGSPNYVTYVTVTKPLFRDVIFLDTAAIAQGPLIGSQLNITFAAPYGTPVVAVLRYAYVVAGTKTQSGGKTTADRWILSESFGIVPSTLKSTPPNLGLTGQALSNDQAEALAQHYAYNVIPNDSPASDVHLASNFNSLPGISGTGYSIALAAAMGNPQSTFHDINTQFQVLPEAKNQFFNQSLLQVKSVFGLSPTEAADAASNTLTTERTYQSPVVATSLDSSFRLGLEYGLHKFANTEVWASANALIAVQTTPSASGMQAFYDPCENQIVVVTIDGGAVTERIFDDKKWVGTKLPIIASQLNAFLIGELLQRSNGWAAIVPVQSNLGLQVSAGTSGTVAIPSTFVPSSLLMVAATVPVPTATATTQASTTAAVLQLFSDTNAGSGGTVPIFEVEVPTVTSGTAGDKSRLFSIPPVPFQSWNINNPSNSSVAAIYGVPKSPYLAAMGTIAPASDATLDKLSAYQLSQLTAASFPVQAASVGAANLAQVGNTFIAYETGGRIDLAYRTSSGNPYYAIRDVCFRVPENLQLASLSSPSSGHQQTWPAVSNPFLVANNLADTISIFYSYKNRVLMKVIPKEAVIFQVPLPSSNAFDVITEARISGSLQQIIPYIAYDGGIADKTTGIKGDLAFGTLAVAPPDPSGTGTSSTPQIAQYSACRTLAGHHFLFVQDGQRIYARRSCDNGATWVDILPSQISLFPQVPGGTPTDPDAPSCFYNRSTNDILLFSVMDNALLMMRIPESALLLSQPDATAAVAKIVPQIVYGKQSANLLSRGIAYQSTVISRQQNDSTLNESVSSQWVAIARTSSGCLRVFFTGSSGFLASLISSDGGALWQSEAQYIVPSGSSGASGAQGA